MTPPLVSVIIPAHDAARFVGQAIESVLAQTYSPLECVVVDDGSTDGTPSVVGGFEAVRYVRQPNRGVSAARNRGAEEATGSFLAFLDADDVWLPTKLERQMALFDDRPRLGLVYCGMRIVDEGLRTRQVMPAAPRSVAVRNTLVLEPPVISIAQTGVIPSAVFRETGGFDETLSTSADADLVCRLGFRYDVDCVDEPLVLYRMHPAQMHLRAETMERDMERVFAKVFGDDTLPTEVRRLEGRARANLYGSLAAESLSRKQRLRGARYAVRAVRSHPRRAFQLLARRFSRTNQR